jgi:hypothetical protein
MYTMRRRAVCLRIYRRCTVRCSSEFPEHVLLLLAEGTHFYLYIRNYTIQHGSIDKKNCEKCAGYTTLREAFLVFIIHPCFGIRR